MMEHNISRPTSPGSKYLKESQNEMLSMGRGTVMTEQVIERTKAKSQMPRRDLPYRTGNEEL